MSCTVQVANHRKAIGLLHASVQTAANAAVPQDQAGLAAALITASFQLASALGLAVFSGIATSRTSHLLATHTPPPEALTAGFQRALLVSALCLMAAGAIALRAPTPAASPPPHQNPTKTWNLPTAPRNTTQRNRRVCGADGRPQQCRTLPFPAAAPGMAVAAALGCRPSARAGDRCCHQPTVRTATVLGEGTVRADRLATVNVLPFGVVSPAVLDPTSCRRPARLAQMDGHQDHGARLLEALAMDPGLDATDRVWAATTLA